MDIHKGQILELFIRKKGYSISELARLMNINRRTIYQHFNSKNLSNAIIFEYAKVLKHDFSQEFPDLSTYSNLLQELIKDEASLITPPELSIENTIWKDRYIQLLEAYNSLLINKDVALKKNSID